MLNRLVFSCRVRLTWILGLENALYTVAVHTTYRVCCLSATTPSLLSRACYCSPSLWRPGLSRPSLPPQHIQVDGKLFETGASVIYTGNAHLFNLTDRVHLNRLDASKQEGPGTGLWDGQRFVLSTTSSGMANLARMGWRYGM